MDEMTPEEEQKLLEELQEILKNVKVVAPKPLEFRAYYDSEGKITTYTTEDLPGDYIVITKDQYNLARHDARVVDGQLLFTHIKLHCMKMTRNNNEGSRTSKYDISILADDDDPEYTYYTIRAYEITR